MKYCSYCGSKLDFRVPEGDNLPRHICNECGTIHYMNPRLIVGCVPVWEDRVLLCKRAIEPRHGFWTIPAGFMENGELVEEGAMRETREEANAEVDIQSVHTVYSIPHINQVYMFFLAKLKNLDFSPGVESLETRLFSEEEIPWDELAFSSVKFCLEALFQRGSSAQDSANLGHFVRSSEPKR
ncbi:MAG: NUDIX hydrolase [Leptospiraceae bacterium]|nr:NUDIX hydrolase [Leptospiraceae bacterium]